MAEKHRKNESIYSTFCSPVALSLAFPLDPPLLAYKIPEKMIGSSVKTVRWIRKKLKLRLK
jgi:hypothetical protein